MSTRSEKIMKMTTCLFFGKWKWEVTGSPWSRLVLRSSWAFQGSKFKVKVGPRLQTPAGPTSEFFYRATIDPIWSPCMFCTTYETLRGSKKGNSFFWLVIYWLINGFIGNPGFGRKTRFLNGNFLIGVAIHPNKKKNGGKHTNFLRRIQCIPLRLKVYG